MIATLLATLPLAKALTGSPTMPLPQHHATMKVSEQPLPIRPVSLPHHPVRLSLKDAQLVIEPIHLDVEITLEPIEDTESVAEDTCSDSDAHLSGNFSDLKYAKRFASRYGKGGNAEAVLDAEPPIQAGNEDTPCSIDVTNADMSAVVRSLAQQSHVGMAILSSTDQKVTLNLTKAPLGEVLKQVCAMTSMSSLKIGSKFVVASESALRTAYPKEWLQANPEAVMDPKSEAAGIPSAETYKCSFTSASQIASVLQRAYSLDQLSVSVLAPSASHPKPEESNQTQPLDTRILPSEVQTTSGQRFSATKASSNAVEVLDEGSLVFRGRPESIESAIELAKKLDRTKPQISVAVTIHDFSNEVVKASGMFERASGSSLATGPSSEVGVGTFNVPRAEFSLWAHNLEQSGGATALAEPSVSIIDQLSTTVFMGARVEMPSVVGYTSANAPIFERRQEPLGINLKVSAVLADSGEIVLNLDSLTASINGSQEGFPQVTKRRTNSALRVKPGGTIVMGGMLTESDLAGFEKVPAVRHNPFFERLIQLHRTTHNSQVVISITPMLTSPAK